MNSASALIREYLPKHSLGSLNSLLLALGCGGLLSSQLSLHYRAAGQGKLLAGSVLGITGSLLTASVTSGSPVAVESQLAEQPNIYLNRKLNTYFLTVLRPRTSTNSTSSSEVVWTRAFLVGDALADP